MYHGRKKTFLLELLFFSGLNAKIYTKKSLDLTIKTLGFYNQYIYGTENVTNRKDEQKVSYNYMYQKHLQLKSLLDLFSILSNSSYICVEIFYLQFHTRQKKPLKSWSIKHSFNNSKFNTFLATDNMSVNVIAFQYLKLKSYNKPVIK